jgi:TPR repeat protein
MLGLQYYNGYGVLQDYIEAYAWWLIAAKNGHKDALHNREIVEKKLTKEQIAKGQALAKALSKKNRQY